MTRSGPPTFAAGALYEGFLQEAFGRFFPRATLELGEGPFASAPGGPALEATDDPTVLRLHWFGAGYRLRAPGRRSFTRGEVRMVRAIESVLAARYRTLFDPTLMAERWDLFRGSAEDRFVGAFLDVTDYAVETEPIWADRIASAIEVLRVAALSSYENRRISSGVLLIDTETDPCRPDQPVPEVTLPYTVELTGVKSFYRLCDGVRTCFLVNRSGRLLGIVDLARWAAEACGGEPLTVPCARGYRAHARATLGGRHACIVLSPSHEIKVFGEGAQLFTFRSARWHLLDLAARHAAWREAVGHADLARRILQSALDLADARQGALFVVVRDAEGAAELLSDSDRLEAPISTPVGGEISRRELLYLLQNQTVFDLDQSVLLAVASMDGATVMDRSGRLLAVGAILPHVTGVAGPRGWVAEGARTTAALAACRFGPVLKVSQDGVITFFDREKIWDI